jgi:hypothetical protein
MAHNLHMATKAILVNNLAARGRFWDFFLLFWKDFIRRYLNNEANHRRSACSASSVFSLSSQIQQRSHRIVPWRPSFSANNALSAYVPYAMNTKEILASWTRKFNLKFEQRFFFRPSKFSKKCVVYSVHVLPRFFYLCYWKYSEISILVTYLCA